MVKNFLFDWGSKFVVSDQKEGHKSFTYNIT